MSLGCALDFIVSQEHSEYAAAGFHHVPVLEIEPQVLENEYLFICILKKEEKTRPQFICQLSLLAKRLDLQGCIDYL